jgi:hypothetical protein
MKVGDLLIDEREIVENVVRSSIMIADLAPTVAEDEPLSRV